MATQANDPLTRVNGDRPHDFEAIAIHTASAVVDTVDRCYRIQDAWSARPMDEFTAGRLAGYEQTLALLLGVPTAEIHRRIRERAL